MPCRLNHALIGPIALLLSAACQTLPDAPAIDSAERWVWSETPTLVASGLNPGETYTLRTARLSPWDPGVLERSSLRYRADDTGRIDIAARVPDGHADASAFLPVREMQRDEDAALEGLEPETLRFDLIDSAGAVVAQRIVATGPDRSEWVEEPLGAAFPGAFVLRAQTGPRPQPRPAIVLLGGSEGGDGSARAAAPNLVAEGYTVLGLPYYSPAWFGQNAQFPDLPRGFAELPVDYLEGAVAALRQRPDVDPDRINLLGGSKGAEYVLLAGSLIPDDSLGGGFCGIVANVPSDMVWEGWGPGTQDGSTSGFSWRGVARPFMPYTDMDRALDRSDPYTMTQAHEHGRRDNPDRIAAARIRVEAIDEPVLVTGGDRDTVWASGRMVRAIRAVRDAAGLDTESYVYPDAGHRVSGPPLARIGAADLAARQETYPATMAFLARVSAREDCRG